MGPKLKSAKPKNSLRGTQGFDDWYSSIYADRWPLLREALLAENKPGRWQSCAAAEPYFLDTGSMLAALALPVADAEHILDMCAAPGGKTVVLASLMSLTARLTANERSSARRMRLFKTVQNCLSETIRNRIQITGTDASRLCLKQQETYDRILLDAPCSSERHVLNAQSYLSQWSYSRVRMLATMQWALISSAYRLLKHGGILVYATCALSPEENDGIIERLVKKYSDMTVSSEFSIPSDVEKFCLPDELPGYEKTAYGFHVLPDRQNGAGPLFFSVIRKS